MYRHGMTSYIGAAWRLKRATMSISTLDAIFPAGWLEITADSSGSRPIAEMTLF